LIPTFLGTEGEEKAENPAGTHPNLQKDSTLDILRQNLSLQKGIELTEEADRELIDILYRTRKSQNKGISITELKR
jgi:hypothetical protein